MRFQLVESVVQRAGSAVIDHSPDRTPEDVRREVGHASACVVDGRGLDLILSGVPVDASATAPFGRFEQIDQARFTAGDGQDDRCHKAFEDSHPGDSAHGNTGRNPPRSGTRSGESVST